MTTNDARNRLNHADIMNKNQILSCVSYLVDEIDTQAETIAEKDQRIAELALGLDGANIRNTKLREEVCDLRRAVDDRNSDIADLRAQLTTARADATRNADAQAALEGLERLNLEDMDHDYSLHYMGNLWVVIAEDALSGTKTCYTGTTPLAAVNAALDAIYGKDTA